MCRWNHAASSRLMCHWKRLELAAADSEWEDAGIVIAAAGAEVARLGGGFRRRDDRKAIDLFRAALIASIRTRELGGGTRLHFTTE